MLSEMNGTPTEIYTLEYIYIFVLNIVFDGFWDPVS